MTFSSVGVDFFIENEKKEITLTEFFNLEPEVKCDIKPFTPVLVRDGDDEVWKPKHFSNSKERHSGFNYGTTDGYTWKQCILADESNYHLINTTEKPNEI